MSKRYYHHKHGPEWAIVIDDDAKVLYIQYTWSNTFERCIAEYGLWAAACVNWDHWQLVTKCRLRKWLKTHNFKDQVVP